MPKKYEKACFTRPYWSNLLIFVVLVSICSSCTQFTLPKQNFTPTPSQKFSIVSWQEYSSLFTSDSGIIHYSLRFPDDWHVYPGATKSEPGLEGETFIQSFTRVNNDNSDKQDPGAVKIEIYALPCAITEEGCDRSGLDHFASDVPGIRKIENRDGWTTWTVFLYIKDYRFWLSGYMTGTPEQNSDNIKILDEILSTVVVQ